MILAKSSIVPLTGTNPSKEHPFTDPDRYPTVFQTLRTKFYLLSQEAKDWLVAHPEIDSLGALTQRKAQIDDLSVVLKTNFETMHTVLFRNYEEWERGNKSGPAPLPYVDKQKEKLDAFVERTKGKRKDTESKVIRRELPPPHEK